MQLEKQGKSANKKTTLKTVKIKT